MPQAQIHIRHILLPCILTAVCLWASAAKVKNPDGRLYVYRYTLKDKGLTPPIDRPQRFLSHQSIERRRRQGLAVDSTDLPISRAYINLFDTEKTRVVGTSRWQQTVLVASRDSLTLRQMGRLPMVSHCRCVYTAPDSVEQRDDIRWVVHQQFNRWDSVRNDPYGMARPQIEQLGGDRLHEAGYRGRGITVAIIDGGFRGYDRIPALRQAHVAGTRDFAATIAAHEDRPFQVIDHGTKVFSVMAAQAPEVIIGTAPEASYWLLRSEIADSEQPVEEDLWTMAAEFADSVGVDVISSSLGYHAYDDSLSSYRHEDLDGQTALISRSASMLARKGIVLCNSAGNAGNNDWRKIGVPADARDIITVGAVDAEGQVASFSSQGPTADRRVKPDVVARGSNTALLSGRGTLVHDMGTSFATPVVSGLVACLWQAMPHKTALQIIDIVRHCADHYDAPDDGSGYGIPNLWAGFALAKSEQ